MSVGRIILKAKTKMSLNDRFTVLRRDVPPKFKDESSLNDRRQAVQASRKNQRLAAQMERRPAVIAALNLKSSQSIQSRINGQPKLTIKQRLFNPNQNTGRRGGIVRGRGLRGARGSRGITRGRGQGSRLSLNRSLQSPGRGRGSPIRSRGGRGRGTIRGRGRRPFNRSSR